MYRSSQTLSHRTKHENIYRIRAYLDSKKAERCGILKRNINLERFLEANQERKDASRRFKAFFVALDILKKSKEVEEKIIDGFVCFELRGLAKDGELVTVHLREEEKNKDKILYLISCFYKITDQKSPSPIAFWERGS